MPHASPLVPGGIESWRLFHRSTPRIRENPGRHLDRGIRGARQGRDDRRLCSEADVQRQRLHRGGAEQAGLLGLFERRRGDLSSGKKQERKRAMSDESKEAAAEIPADEVLRGLQNFQSWGYAVASALPYATALVSQYREAKREMAEIVRVRETHLADLERAIAER